jgi:hypothetical protein
MVDNKKKMLRMTLEDEMNDDATTIPSNMEDLIDFIKRKRRTTGRRVNFEPPENYFGQEGVKNGRVKLFSWCF